MTNLKILDEFTSRCPRLRRLRQQYYCYSKKFKFDINIVLIFNKKYSNEFCVILKTFLLSFLFNELI